MRTTIQGIETDNVHSGAGAWSTMRTAIQRIETDKVHSGAGSRIIDLWSAHPSVSHIFSHSFAFQRKPSPPPREMGTVHSGKRHARLATDGSAQPSRRNTRRGSRTSIAARGRLVHPLTLQERSAIVPITARVLPKPLVFGATPLGCHTGLTTWLHALREVCCCRRNSSY